MSNNIVFFDGNCNLCNGFVNLLLGKKPPFLFASLQGESAGKILPENLRTELSSVVYFRDGRLLMKSRALVAIFRDVGGIYRVYSFFLRVLPDFFSDGIYRWIARGRYRWFGKRETCRLPTAEEKDYFLP